MIRIIKQNEKGYLFKNGRFVRCLDAGKYHTFMSRQIEVRPLDAPLGSVNCNIETLLANKVTAANTTQVTVGDEQLAFHFVDGKYRDCLSSGKYAYWNEAGKHTFIIADISVPEVSADVPLYVIQKINAGLFIKVEVAEFERGRLYYNNKFVRLLSAGTYYFWKTGVKVNVDLVDIRLTQMDIAGQEILTQDKVSLRINFVLHYRITDCVKVATEIDDYKEQLHVAVQLALRDYVGRYRIDEILESKDQISSYVFGKLKEKENELFISVADAGVKDIILPGEIRDIMNTVLVAEKRAQANVITRREEVASTRSLLNTAKLMEENKTLYEMKKLEYLERICEKVGNINVTGSGDILSQLANVVKGAST